MSLKDFHKETDTMVAKTAFYESEINREVQIFEILLMFGALMKPD